MAWCHGNHADVELTSGQMENLIAMQRHEGTATRLNPGNNGFKIAHAIHRLRYDMSTQQPINHVLRQLRGIQTDCNKVFPLLSKLYKYTDEASAILTEWESALHDDLRSIESDVTNYKMSPEEETDTGYTYVKLNYKEKAMDKRVEDLQEKIATWFGTKLPVDTMAILQPADSWSITLMIPEMFTEKFQKSFKLCRKWYSDQGVDSVELNDRTIDVTDEQPTDAVGCTGDIRDITKPQRFTEANGLTITDKGSVVEAEDLFYRCFRAVTDGRFRTGRYYWELQIACSSGCACDVGVVQESCGLMWVRSPHRQCWYITMEYSGCELRCDSPCECEIRPDCVKGRRPYTGTHHVGVYLDCDHRTLIILDSGQNQVIATVRGLEVTEHLVPWIQFHGREDGVPFLGDQPACARLVTGVSATPPQVLCDMLNTF